MMTATPVTNWPSLSSARREYDAGDETAKQEHARVDEAASKRRDFATRLNQLQFNVDRATESLALTESRANLFKSRITQLRETVNQLWGQDMTVANVDPAVSLLDAYQSIDTLISATADFPRVREQLVKNLNAAKLVLDNFQRDNQP